MGPPEVPCWGYSNPAERCARAARPLAAKVQTRRMDFLAGPAGRATTVPWPNRLRPSLFIQKIRQAPQCSLYRTSNNPQVVS